MAAQYDAGAAHYQTVTKKRDRNSFYALAFMHLVGGSGSPVAMLS